MGIESYPDNLTVKEAIQKRIKGDLDELWSLVQAATAGSGVLISANDQNVGYLVNKLLAGNGITLTKGNPLANETLTIRVDLRIFADEASMTAGSVDGERAMIAANGNRYAWDNTGLKWRILPGNLYAADPSDTTYTIGTGTIIINTTTGKIKRWTGTAWVDYATEVGFFAAYAKVSHTLPSGTNGGSTTAAAWNTRPINTEESDPDGIVTLSANKIKPAAGTYIARGWSVVFDVGTHQTRLRNTTTDETMIKGESGYSNPTYPNVVTSRISGKFTVADGDELELQHYTAKAKNNTGLGRDAGSGEDNVYANLEFFKLRT